MPYERSLEPTFAHYRWQGEFTKHDLDAIARDLPILAQETGRAPDVMLTFAEGTIVRTEPWALFEYSIRRRNTALPNPAKVAWVVDTPELKAVVRMFQELNRNPHIEIRSFRTEKAARKWLVPAGARRTSNTRRRTSNVEAQKDGLRWSGLSPRR